MKSAQQEQNHTAISAVLTIYVRKRYNVDNTYYYVYYNHIGEYDYAVNIKGNDKKLKKYGFKIVSQNGSHVKMFNAKTNKTIIIPYHSKDLKKGLEQAILKQAGIQEEK